MVVRSSPQPFICRFYLFYFIADKMSADTINGGVMMGKKSLLLRILHMGMGETAQWLLYSSQGLHDSSEPSITGSDASSVMQEYM